MISGGMVGNEGRQECGSATQEVSKFGDFNFDGHPDTIHAITCPDQYFDVYLEVDPTHAKIGRTLFGPGPNSYDPLTPGAYKFNASALPGFRGASKQGGFLFSAGDLVQAPFGRREGKPQGRIQDFYFEFDRNLNWIRTVAAIYTAEGSDYFDLSALTLISPVIELERQADVLIQQFRKTKDFKRREELLRYAERIDGLKIPFQKEAKSIEERLALAFENRIARLDLDPEGKRILLEKMGEKLGFHFRATSLAWSAREKLAAK